ncbi:Rtt106-domain-containing protein [Parathielavia appendiculata]|uniref:Rtt106-domain-containing protein n=1 Tax=Parathielavia appendiculata TaxID=2587402 RepID=A0AAN6Z0K9_9PEZI|nr:Rtt106-domain-containing protein [Parathielavia appendiculata]
MTVQLDHQTLGIVFQSRPDILASIQTAADSPARIRLFNDIASYVHERLGSADAQDGPASKRRRIDVAQSPTQTHPIGHTQSRPLPAGSQLAALSPDAASQDFVLLEINDISITAPQRKKYDLCFTKNFLYARAPGTSVPLQGIVYPWKSIEHAFYLPVPDKSQVQYNYVLLPRDSYLPTTKQGSTNPGDRQTPLEPLVFTVPATAPKPGSVGGPSVKTAEAVSDTYSSLFHWALTTSMRSAGNHSCQLIGSDPKLFHSVARQPHRPNEKAVHVKAFRGSKDGFLFFLPTGILWGFKKPLLFLPLDRIVAVSYTNVLRTTFNIVVELDTDHHHVRSGDANGGGAVEKEIEFGMIDQEDYRGIDETYVRRHGLADRSMAEQRKAKRELAENIKKHPAAAGEGDIEGKAEGGSAADDGLTELERAQREAEQRLQDEEDEMEEDYDPGSEGESEGEGGSSEEEEDDDEDAQGEYDEDDEDEGGED